MTTSKQWIGSYLSTVWGGVGGFVDKPQAHQEVMQQPALHSVALLIGLTSLFVLSVLQQHNKGTRASTRDLLLTERRAQHHRTGAGQADNLLRMVMT